MELRGCLLSRTARIAAERPSKRTRHTQYDESIREDCQDPNEEVVIAKVGEGGLGDASSEAAAKQRASQEARRKDLLLELDIWPPNRYRWGRFLSRVPIWRCYTSYRVLSH